MDAGSRRNPWKFFITAPQLLVNLINRSLGELFLGIIALVVNKRPEIVNSPRERIYKIICTKN
jgi:hypothetical protein